MKTLYLILFSGVVLALAGCGNQGGSSDDYNRGSGSASQSNYDRGSFTNNHQGGALSPGRSEGGVIQSTNYPGFGNDGQTSPTNSDNQNGGRPLDAQRTNNLPEN